MYMVNVCNSEQFAFLKHNYYICSNKSNINETVHRDLHELGSILGFTTFYLMSNQVYIPVSLITCCVFIIKNSMYTCTYI